MYLDVALYVALLVANFSLIMTFFRLFGKTGLISWCAISSVLANIQVTKNISFFGLDATLGNITYATGFLATDILCEFYGDKEAREAASAGLLATAAMTIIMKISVLITPSSSDIVQNSLENIFSLVPRICLASMLAYGVSSFHDIFAYKFWRKKTSGRMLWLRNNASTFVSQLIDTIIFTVVSFAGIYNTTVLFDIGISTLLIKWLTALADTPVIYLARYWVHNGRIPGTCSGSLNKEA